MTRQTYEKLTTETESSFKTQTISALSGAIEKTTGSTFRALTITIPKIPRTVPKNPYFT